MREALLKFHIQSKTSTMLLNKWRVKKQYSTTFNAMNKQNKTKSKTIWQDLEYHPIWVTQNS